MNRFKELKIGQRVEIHSYKHNSRIHRVWKYGYVVDIGDDYLVVLNNKTRVIESSGRVWYTKEPAVCFFFTDKWYNIISMIRSNGIHYYCNIASPFTYDGEAIKYIDYDLDLKVFPNDSMKVLDEREYANHSKIMNYSKEIDEIVHQELKNLQDVVLNPDNIYNRVNVYDYLDKFKKEKMDNNREI
ncbi:protein associated with RNAse G/E [Bacilli bacterium PM5-3]|nr:protein associated with RNAse G/E [Bacilli bacterium PM5-3]MDH6603538.1 protein associated with RNAse G/E [Bacilli bacterium PM5-9]